MVKVGSVTKLNIENENLRECRVHQTVNVRSSNSPNSEQLFKKIQNLTISPNSLNSPNRPNSSFRPNRPNIEQFVLSEQSEHPDLAIKWPSKVRMSLPDPWSLIPTRFSPYPVAGPFWWPLIRCLNKFLSPTIPGIKLCCVKLKSRNSGVKWRKAKF